MSLPTQLQKQLETAKSLVAQHYGLNEGADKPTEETAAPAAESSTPEGQENEQSEQTASSGAPESSQTRPAEDENDSTYAQRWRTLQGAYNALKPKYEDAMQRISAMEQVLASMQTAPAPAAPQVTPTQAKFVSEKDVEDYGADLVDMVRRAAREESAALARAVQALAQQVEQLKGLTPVVQKVAHTQAVSAEAQFFGELSQRIPDWQVLNDDPKFHQWLMSPDFMTGITRQTYLADAQQALDADRVVAIFTAYKREAGVVETPVQSSSSQKTSTVTKLEKQVAPGRASAATPAPQPRTGKQWTRSEIAKFYDDKRRGVYKGREADALALERDIFQAQQEGRIAA